MWSEDSRLRLAQYRFVLGSSSPRRKEILAGNLGVTDFTVVTSTFEENLPKTVADVDYVAATAAHKIPSIVSQLSQDHRHVLLVADTVVSCGGRILEKPGSPEAQLQMLQHYRKHPQDVRVITAVNVCKVENGTVTQHEQGLEITSLLFNSSLTDAQLAYYVQCGEGEQVAGGFKYQEQGSMLFSGIDGDYFNVVGLPVRRTHELLSKVID